MGEKKRRTTDDARIRKNLQRINSLLKVNKLILQITSELMDESELDLNELVLPTGRDEYALESKF